MAIVQLHSVPLFYPNLAFSLLENNLAPDKKTSSKSTVKIRGSLTFVLFVTTPEPWLSVLPQPGHEPSGSLEATSSKRPVQTQHLPASLDGASSCRHSCTAQRNGKKMAKSFLTVFSCLAHNHNAWKHRFRINFFWKAKENKVLN